MTALNVNARIAVIGAGAMGAGIALQDELGREMPEQMRVEHQPTAHRESPLDLLA